MKRDRRMIPTTNEGGTALEDNRAWKVFADSRRQKSVSDIRNEQEPPEREIIPHTDKGPRKLAAGEPENRFSGKYVRIDLMKDQVEGDRYYLDTTRPLERHQQDMVIAAGFDPIGELDTALHWEATRENVARSGKDLNVLAITLDGKQERLGRSR